jgi:hypothetical protein
MGVSTGGVAAGRPPLGPLLLAGLAGAAVFEFIALVLAPAVLGPPIMPARLVANLGAVLTGVEWPMLAAGSGISPPGSSSSRWATWPCCG